MSTCFLTESHFTLKFILYALVLFKITNGIGDVQSFSIKTAEFNYAATAGTITVTLWFNSAILQCDIQPSTHDTTYICASDNWTVLSSNCLNSEYKIMVDNPNNNAVVVDSVLVTDTLDAWWGTKSWCIPSGAVNEAVNSGYEEDWEITDGACGDGYSHYKHLCVDNEIDDCSPVKQIIYFNINAQNTYSDASAWTNGAGLSIGSTCNPTVSPTNIPSISPLYTTYSPGVIPTLSTDSKKILTPSTPSIQSTVILMTDSELFGSANNKNMPFSSFLLLIPVAIFICIIISIIVKNRKKSSPKTTNEYDEDEENQQETETVVIQTMQHHMAELETQQPENGHDMEIETQEEDAESAETRQLRPDLEEEEKKIHEETEGDSQDSSSYEKIPNALNATNYDDRAAEFEAESDSSQLFVNIPQDKETRDEIETYIIDSNNTVALRAWFDTHINIPNLKNFYFQLFIDNGYETVQIVQLLTEEKLKMIGIKKQGHIDLIMMQINNLKFAYCNTVEGDEKANYID